MVSVGNHHRMPTHLKEYFRILSGKFRKLPYGRIFFKYYFAVVISKYFQRVALADSHGTTNFLWYNYAAKVINPPHNSGCFHIWHSSFFAYFMSLLFAAILNLCKNFSVRF